MVGYTAADTNILKSAGISPLLLHLCLSQFFREFVSVNSSLAEPGRVISEFRQNSYSTGGPITVWGGGVTLPTILVEVGMETTQSPQFSG